MTEVRARIARPRRVRQAPLSAAVLALVAMTAIAQPVQGQVTGMIRASGEEAELRLEEIVAIGSLDGDLDAFGGVDGVAIDSRGRILVLDASAGHLKVFLPSGKHLVTVGRRGEGPGEFSSPLTIGTGPGDSVFVWDGDRSRVSVFSPSYEWVRDVRVSPAWLVRSIVPRADGTLAVAAFGRGDRFPAKVVDSVGTVLWSGGTPVRARSLYGFEDSLLGGRLARSASGYVYAGQSPMVLEYMDDALRTLRVCRGATELTTNPADVVEFDGHTARIRWGEYVHVASVLPLDSNLFLVTIRAPGDDRRVLQVVSRRCELAAEMEIDFPITPKAVQGELIAAVRTLDYPEVVIYRATMVGP